MSIGPARPLPLAASVGPRAAQTVPAPTVLSRREAMLRSAATTCLLGVALVQSIELPSLLGKGAQPVVLSAVAAALCVGLGTALAAAPGSTSRELWRAVAAVATLVLAGWAAPRAVALPHLAGSRGDWASMPGLACGMAAAACLVLAVAATATSGGVRAAARGLATALAVLVVLAPGAGALTVALGPGPAGGENAIAADVHVHAHSTAPEPDIRLQRGPNGNHSVTAVARPPHAPAVGVALVVAAAFAFLCGAVGYLRRRSAPLRPVVGGGAA